MSRRRSTEEVYKDDNYYEIDQRRRSRDDRHFNPDSDPRRRHRVARSPSGVRETEERVRVRRRDRSASDPLRENFRPLRDEDGIPLRQRDRIHSEDLPLQRETEEVYVQRGTPPSRHRHRPRGSREEVILDEIDKYNTRRPREKEEIVFDERREVSRPREEVEERDEVVFRKRDRSLPPRRLREDEAILIEKDRRRSRAISSDRESVDEEKVVLRRRDRRPRQNDDVERERKPRHRRSLPPLESYRREDEEEDVIFLQKDRSSSRQRRRSEKFLPQEEEREEEIIFQERDGPPSRRRMREEVVVRREDRSSPRRRRPQRRYDDETDEVLIRQRSHSIPVREEEIDEVVVKRKNRSMPRIEDDREEIILRERDYYDSIRDDDDRGKVRVHRRHRSSRHKNGDRDDVVLRSTHSLNDDEREEVIIRKDKHDRRRSLGPDIEEDELRIRDDEVDHIEFRHVHKPIRSRSRLRGADMKEEIIIRDDDLERRHGSKEIIIRKDEEEDDDSSSSDSSSPEPPIVRKPTVLQEVITHHRHIDSYETIPPQQEIIEDEVEETEIREKGERNGRLYTEEIIIDRQEKERDVSPPRHRHSLPVEEEELIIEQTRSGDHGHGRELVLREEEVEQERREDIIEEYPEVKEEIRVHKKYKEPRNKRWTEISKDLIIREALRRLRYDFEESDHFYYVFDYLRYRDVERLVNLSDDIRRFRPERTRKIRREREKVTMLPGPPPIAPRSPYMRERRPPREEEVVRERDVFIEDDRRRPRRYREV